MRIREETPEDFTVVWELNEQAFGGAAEARLVDMFRTANKAVVSLVATIDRRTVGHILFSPVTVTVSPKDFRAVELTPMSVLPEVQNRGIGSSLVREGLAACRRKGYDAVVVLGHSKYYPRFGFLRAADYGLDSEYNAPESFMVVELKEGALCRRSVA